MNKMNIIAVLGVLLLAGCSSFFYNPERSIDRYFASYKLTPPISPGRFMVCNHYGCAGQVQVSLTDEQWQLIKTLFLPAAETALAERKMIAAAIGLMEQMVGPQSNTFADQACNNFRQPIESYQLDCVAEATNATVFLQLFQQQLLLRWHQVSYPASREMFIFLFPHVSAVIRQKDTAELFAVDSWFNANGEKAVVVPLKLWSENYYPGSCSENVPQAEGGTAASPSS